MADDMAMFEAEIGKIDSPAQEKHIDELRHTVEKENEETVEANLKRGRAENAREQEIEETGEAKSKPSLAQEAVRRWKQRRIEEELALEEAGKGAWTEHKDPGSGAAYYYNSVTKKSSWTRPPDFVEPSSTEPVIVASTPKWTVSKDPVSGNLYYYNKESGQSTWERPSDYSEAATPAAGANATSAVHVATGSATSPSAEDWDVDEVIDLVASTRASEFSCSDQIHASVSAESEDGISVVGFILRLNTQFSELMEAWSDYQELPAESVYFQAGGRLLAPSETPGDLRWTQERGTLKIEAKPCEEVTDEEAEAELKKQQKKQKKKSKQPQVEFITEF